MRIIKTANLFVFLAAFLMVLAACGRVDEPLPTLNTMLSCEQLILTALESAAEQCSTPVYGQACYGYKQVDADLQRSAEQTFAQPGDTLNLVDLQAIFTTPLDPVQQSLGMTTLSGQGIRYVLFGGASLTDIVPLMTAATLQTVIIQDSCQGAPGSGLLAQAVENVQANLTLNGANLTIGSTIYITALSGNVLNIATLDGVTIVSAFDTSRIVRAGFQVALPLGGDTGLEVTGPPSDLQPYDLRNAVFLPFALLERTVNLPPAPASGTPESADNSQTTQPIRDTAEPCEGREDWTGSYTAQRGDNLTIIAQFYNTTVAELQAANCLSDPNRIRSGDVLIVPELPPTATPES